MALMRRGRREDPGDPGDSDVAVLARVTRGAPVSSDDLAEVRSAVERAGRERTVRTVAVVDLGDGTAESFVDAVAAAIAADGARVAVAGRDDPRDSDYVVVRAGADLEAVRGRADAVVVAVPGEDVDAATDRLRETGEALLGIVLLEPAAAQPAPAPVPAPDADGLESRARELAEREAVLDRREAEASERLAAERRRITELVRRQQAVEAREAELQRLVASVEERYQALAHREYEVVQEEELLAARKQELDERAAEVERRAEAAAALPVAEPAAEQRVEAPAGWTMQALEHRVRDAFESGAPESIELEAYVVSLRPHAGADGRIPPEFDSLIVSVFGEADQPVPRA